jgi:hypothetical protein
MDSTIYFLFYYALEREYYKSKPFLNHSGGEKTTKIPLFANYGLKLFLKRRFYVMTNAGSLVSGSYPRILHDSNNVVIKIKINKIS